MKAQAKDLDKQLYATSRLEALTDGVFAIAMTLLVLDLSASEFGRQLTSAGLWQALVSAHETFTSFAISFLLLCSMWAVHMRQFEFIQSVDKWLATLNTIRLLIVVLMPLSTALGGNYQDLALGHVLLPINFFLLTVISYAEWLYAVKDDRKVPAWFDERQRLRADTRNRAIILLSLLVIPLSIPLGALAFLTFLLSSPLTKLLQNFYGTR